MIRILHGHISLISLPINYSYMDPICFDRLGRRFGLFNAGSTLYPS